MSDIWEDIDLAKAIQDKAAELNKLFSQAARSSIEVNINMLDVRTMADAVEHRMINVSCLKLLEQKKE